MGNYIDPSSIQAGAPALASVVRGLFNDLDAAVYARLTGATPVSGLVVGAGELTIDATLPAAVWKVSGGKRAVAYVSGNNMIFERWPSGAYGGDFLTVALATGAVTIPNLVASALTLDGRSVSGKRYNFSAHKNGSAQSIANDTVTKVTFGSEHFDPEGVFDTANSRFVAPVTGIYEFELTMNFTSASSGGSFQPRLRLNNTSNPRELLINTYGTGTVSFMLAARLSLTAGDYVEAFIYQFTSASRDVSGQDNRTWFSGGLAS